MASAIWNLPCASLYVTNYYYYYYNAAQTSKQCLQIGCCY